MQKEEGLQIACQIAYVLNGRGYSKTCRNILAQSYKFLYHAQCPSETAKDYIAALRELAVTCYFTAMRDEMIRDQLVEKTISEKICEKLSMEEKLTLPGRKMEGAKAITASASLAVTPDIITIFQALTSKGKHFPIQA